MPMHMHIAYTYYSYIPKSQACSDTGMIHKESSQSRLTKPPPSTVCMLVTSLVQQSLGQKRLIEWCPLSAEAYTDPKWVCPGCYTPHLHPEHHLVPVISRPTQPPRTLPPLLQISVQRVAGAGLCPPIRPTVIAVGVSAGGPSAQGRIQGRGLLALYIVSLLGDRELCGWTKCW